MSDSSDNLVTVMIDGVEHRVPGGMNLIDAAATVGVYIPHYCYHPALPVDGSCRLCLVELAGRPKLEPACNMVASDGLEFFVDSDAAINSREGMMEFLLVNHPLDCPVCDQGGECQLQNYAMDYGIEDARTVDRRRRYPKPNFDPLIDLERNRCILCTRCVRFCDHVGGKHALGIVERGDRNRIATYGDQPIDNILSGNVIDLCPVGALTAKAFRFKARPWELRQTQTTCGFCSAGCRVTVWTRDGRVYRTTTRTVPGDVNFVIDDDTREFICNQGRFGGDYAHHPERFFRASVDGDEATAEEAVEAIATRLSAIRDEHGSEAIGVIVSARATNEEMLLARRLATDVLGGARIDTRAYLIDEDAAREHDRAMSASRGWLTGIENYDAVIVLNGALSDEGPVAAMKIRDAARDGQVRLALAGWRNDAYLASQAEVIERVTIDGLAVWSAQPGAIGAMLKDCSKGLVVYCPTEARGQLAGDLNDAAFALRAAGGDGWDLLAIDPARNAVGAHVFGANSDGGVSSLLADAKAALVIGADGLDCALDSVESVFAVDAFSSAISERADVVLPAATSIEKTGSLCDLEGGVALLSPSDRPSGESRPEVDWLIDIANALGAGWEAEDADALFAEAMRETAPTCPLSRSSLEDDGPGDECPIRCIHRPQTESRVSPGKWETLLPTHVPVCDARGAAAFGERQSAAMKIPEDGGLLLTGSLHVSGRDHRGNRSEAQPSLMPAPYVVLDESEAEARGLSEGDTVALTIGERTVRVELRLAPMVAGVAWAAANVLPDGMWDGALARCEIAKVEEAG